MKSVWNVFSLRDFRQTIEPPSPLQGITPLPQRDVPITLSQLFHLTQVTNSQRTQQIYTKMDQPISSPCRYESKWCKGALQHAGAAVRVGRLGKFPTLEFQGRERVGKRVGNFPTLLWAQKQKNVSIFKTFVIFQ